MITTMRLNANGHRLLRKEGSEMTVKSEPGEERPDSVHGAYPACAVCDEWPTYVLRGSELHVQDPCPYPMGITTEVTLDVPSGKLIVSDDLRDVYDTDFFAGADYNTTLGQAQVIKAMAALGCAFGPVSNTCPGLYSTGATSYVIASVHSDEDTDGPALPESDRLASICTDLWAYMLADFEDWKSRGGNPHRRMHGDYTVIDVPRGTYKITHHTGEHGFDRDAPGIVEFAHIERVAPLPAP
ncbi:hypothetical protein [Streptomyces yaizuensis]|uniref:Uncharacterized protein n=1 Tax=Streptomyces yaizuensis TaxID=2989713 RepID=A0ABQ5PBL4_9ACTN|nr:hypothetical protein [Streptomyces sp. YSPA8]GLF99937.1 hypothetical protein SYYSPA8_36590 [Streptomyces sp. YSPA8]